jgi:hypothetical protein
MPETYTKGEMHGCVVCGKLYQLYVVYDANDRFVDCKVMSPGGKRVPDPRRPLAVCETHSDAQVEAALARIDILRKDDN